MILIKIPGLEPRPLAFFLALEEWVARTLDAGEYFFTWNVAPTVIIGHNQDLESEVNVEYCKEHGIDIVRRRSGGGCVYADRDNIMMSYVCPDTNVDKVFGRYTSLIAKQLQSIGIKASPSGRNDIEVEGRKVSGNAFYLMADRSIVHGTMLYDTNTANMLNAITPSRAKLESHGVKSVEARITTIKRLRPDLTLEKFHEGLIDGLTTGVHEMSEAEIKEVEVLEQRYYDSDWHLKGHRKVS